VPDERLRQRAREQGQALAKEQQEHTRQILKKAVARPTIGNQRGREKQERLWSRLRGSRQDGMDGTSGGQIDPVGKKGRHRLTTRWSVATFGVAGDLGRLATACHMGIQWITPQAEEPFPQAAQMLDGSHMWRTVRDAVRSLPPGKQSARPAWIGDSRSWQEHGSPVGNGLVERAVAVVITLRMTRCGIHWLRPRLLLEPS
jgi:hypothetical protein